jgi:hypothetical protein
MLIPPPIVIPLRGGADMIYILSKIIYLAV